MRTRGRTFCPPPDGRRGEQTRPPPSRAVRGREGGRGGGDLFTRNGGSCAHQAENRGEQGEGVRRQPSAVRSDVLRRLLQRGVCIANTHSDSPCAGHCWLPCACSRAPGQKLKATPIGPPRSIPYLFDTRPPLRQAGTQDILGRAGRCVNNNGSTSSGEGGMPRRWCWRGWVGSCAVISSQRTRGALRSIQIFKYGCPLRQESPSVSLLPYGCKTVCSPRPCAAVLVKMDCTAR